MRENRTYGSEGGESEINRTSLPLSCSLAMSDFIICYILSSALHAAHDHILTNFGCHKQRIPALAGLPPVVSSGVISNGVA